MQATIKYTLSSEGQKAALLAGQPGVSSREDSVEIPADAVDLFEIDYQGKLSADLRTGSETPSWGGTWKNIEFDSPLIAEAAISFLRKRQIEREAHNAAKAREKEEQARKDAEAAAVQRAADLQALQGAAESGTIPADFSMLNHHAGKIEIGRRTYSLDDADARPFVERLIETHRAALSESAAKAKAEAERQATRKKIPNPPVVRGGELTGDGKIHVVIPDPGGESWSKHVTSINDKAANGSAFEGPWLKCGVPFRLEAGAVIVVGSKWNEGSNRRPEWKRTRDLYIVTPAGVCPVVSNTAERAKDLLAQDPADRVVEALTLRIKTCTEQIAKLDALDDPEFGPFRDVISERRMAWIVERTRLSEALAKATAEPAISTVEEAAEAIIKAGYRALAGQHHPDKGGDLTTMKLINEARQALRELLALAKGAESE